MIGNLQDLSLNVNNISMESQVELSADIHRFNRVVSNVLRHNLHDYPVPAQPYRQMFHENMSLPPFSLGGGAGWLGEPTTSAIGSGTGNQRIRFEEYDGPDGTRISISEFSTEDLGGEVDDLFSSGGSINRLIQQALNSLGQSFPQIDITTLSGGAPPPRVLPEELKQYLPIAPYGEMKTEDEHSIACTVCQLEFQDSVMVRCLPCTHLFHVGCIDEWLKRSIHCPNCRLNVEESVA